MLSEKDKQENDKNMRGGGELRGFQKKVSNDIITSEVARYGQRRHNQGNQERHSLTNEQTPSSSEETRMAHNLMDRQEWWRHYGPR